MTRLDRLKEYSNPLHGPQGAGRDQANVDYWSARAKENSKVAPRASNGPMKLPSTKVNVRDTSMRPREARNADKRMVAKDDLNVEGSSPYLRGVRRQT
jgi:hypothetical protein